MAEHVLDNLVGPPSTVTSGGGAQVIGHPFRAKVTGLVTKLGWYRADADPDKPNSLALWSNNFQGAYVIASPVSDNGSVGWQWTTLSSPIQIFAGQTYIVSAHVSNGVTLAFTGGSPALPAETTSLKSELPNAVGATNANHVYPINSLGSTNLYWYDVEFETLSPDTVDPSTAGAILDQKLAAWFSTNDNTHTAEVPYQTYVRAGEAKAAAEAAEVAAAAAQTAAENVDVDLAPVTTALSSVQANQNTLLSRLSADLATLLNDASEGLVAWLNGAGADPTQWWTAFLSHFTAATGGSGFGGPDPLEGWTLQDTLEFTDEAAWAQEADLYRLNLDSTGSLQPADPVAGVPVTYRLGWWSPLNGQFMRQRGYVDSPTCDLIGPSGRMPGLVLFLNHGGHGTIEAWTKD